MAAFAAFFFTPLGKAVLLILALVAAVGYIDRRATYRERAKCESAKIQSRLDAANRDLEISKRAERDAKVALDELAKQRSDAERENEDLQKRVSELPLAEQCIITDRTRRVR